jgi:CRISPR/Cas system-associated exonuclease Cas4 (RecB family)
MPTDLTPADLEAIKNHIEDGIEEWSVRTLSDEPRTHLGISEIGEPCSRKLWYKFRWVSFEKHDGRMLRLLKRGHREEEKYINYLKGIGCTVKRFTEDGKQFKVPGVLGHYGGSCDGICSIPWSDQSFLLEFKTHNTKSFSYYVQNGLAKAKPMHIDQMHCYGWKLNLQYGIYFPENKNDDDIQVEVIKLDWLRAQQLERKAEEIINAKEPPAKISNNPSFFNCSYCHYKPICHFDAVPVRNCRSCRMATAVDNGEWLCGRYGQVIERSFIPKGCDKWVAL